MVDFSYLWPGQFWLVLLLLMGLAFAAAGSYRQEKENRVLELLLVTPLTERQIIGDRVRAIWGQFAPAAAVLILAGLCLVQDERLFKSFAYDQFSIGGLVAGNLPGLALFSLSTYLTMPIIGLYLSLRPWPFLAAWLLTGAWGMLFPVLFPWIVFWSAVHSGLPPAFFGPTLPLSIISVVQLASGLVAGALLYRDLARRRFVIAA